MVQIIEALTEKRRLLALFLECRYSVQGFEQVKRIDAEVDRLTKEIVSLQRELDRFESEAGEGEVERFIVTVYDIVETKAA